MSVSRRDFNPPTGVQHGRVVPATKRVADLRQTMVGQFLRQRHANLPRPGNRPASSLRQQVPNADLKILRDSFLDVFDRNQSVLQRQQISQRLLGEIQVDRPAGEAGISDHAAQRPFELSHIRANALRNEKSDLLRQLNALG